MSRGGGKLGHDGDDGRGDSMGISLSLIGGGEDTTVVLHVLTRWETRRA